MRDELKRIVIRAVRITFAIIVAGVALYAALHSGRDATRRFNLANDDERQGYAK